MASDFITGEDLPKLLATGQYEGARILPLILSHPAFSRTRLGQFQAFNDPARPLKTLPEYEKEAVWARFAKTIYEILTEPFPPGMRLLTYAGHASAVTTVFWSTDSRRIASGSNDSTVQVWDGAIGQHLFTYTADSNSVMVVAWSPDGKSIASGSGDEMVQVWDAATGQRLATYTGHDDSIYALAWSPDGTSIASAGYDHTVQVWSAGERSWHAEERDIQ